MRTKPMSHPGTLPSLSLGNSHAAFLICRLSLPEMTSLSLILVLLFLLRVLCSYGRVNALKCPFRVDMRWI